MNAINRLARWHDELASTFTMIRYSVWHGSVLTVLRALGRATLTWCFFVVLSIWTVVGRKRFL